MPQPNQNRINPNVDFTKEDSTGGGNENGSYELNDTPAHYADFTDCDSIKISYEVVYADQVGLDVLNYSAITEKALVGDNGGYVNIIVKHVANGVVIAKDVYSLDEWIEMATGEEYNDEMGEWVPGGTAVEGYEISFSSGDQEGTTNVGPLDIWFGLTAQLSDSSYAKAVVCLTVNVLAQSSWYDDDNGVSIELMPIPSFCELRATVNGITKAVVEEYEYVLIDSATPTASIPSLNTDGGIDMTPIYDKRTGEWHYYVGSVEIYGVLRNVIPTMHEGTTIPEASYVELFNDFIPPNDGESNIEVLYPCYVAGNADKIDKCRIAKLFGNANAKNRLFVSGNPDLPNCDWHSSARSDGEEDSNGDFSYFGDMDYCFYGQTDNEIMGYDNVATDKMVVLKSKSKVEPTNYFRTSTLIQAIDASGNALSGVDGSTLYQESFPLATGNIGAGAMNMNSIINLNGDTLYLSSENTICGLDITGQIGDSQRISYSRSRYIDPELKELDLSDAVLWTDNNFAFLFAGEATYVTHYETYDSETGQYEWFKLDIKGVRCAIEVEGEIYFGTDTGLYKFEKNKYSDCNKLFLNVGATLYSEDKISYSSSYDEALGDGKNLTFKPKTEDLSSSLFRKVAHAAFQEANSLDLLIDRENNAVKIVALDSDGHRDADRYMVLLEELAYGGWFYLNGTDEYDRFRLAISDDYEDEYKIIDEDGDEYDMTEWPDNGQFDLCRVLDGEYVITDLDKTNHTFKIRENGRVLDIIQYSVQSIITMSFASEIHIHKPVKSYFIAAPAPLGDISYRKTIWAWTLSAFKEANDLQVCQATNEENLEDMKALAFADSVPIGLSLHRLSFENLDFGKSTVPRKYTYFRPLSVPFVSFGFKSDKDANSILTATSIVYTIPMLGRGDR